MAATYSTPISLKGVPGTNGLNFLSGEGTPIATNTLGTEGETYLDHSTGEVWKYTSGAWADTGSTLRGLAGLRGSQFFSGSGAPDLSQYPNAANGDLYLDTQAQALYVLEPGVEAQSSTGTSTVVSSSAQSVEIVKMGNFWVNDGSGPTDPTSMLEVIASCNNIQNNNVISSSWPAFYPGSVVAIGAFCNGGTASTATFTLYKNGNPTSLTTNVANPTKETSAYATLPLSQGVSFVAGDFLQVYFSFDNAGGGQSYSASIGVLLDASDATQTSNTGNA